MIASSYAGSGHVDPGRDDDDDLPRCPRATSASTHSTIGTSAGPRNVSEPGQRGRGRRADGDQQVVVGALLARAEANGPRGDVDAGQLTLHQRHRVAARQVVEVERRRSAEPERRRDRRRPVLEGVRRGDELDLEAAAGEVAQRQDGLDGRDPGAGDQDA